MIFLRALILSTLFAVPIFGGQEAFMVEGHVQSDLDAALSRMIPSDQYLIQVTGEVQTRMERKIVEGETMTQGMNLQNEVAPPPVMPGFVTEPQDSKEAATNPFQNRQTFRMVETPTLTALKVRATFDDGLPSSTVTRAKSLIAAYLKSNYPTVSYVAFSSMPMIKQKSLERDLAALLNLKKDDPESFWGQMRWVIAAFLALVFLMMVFGRANAPRRSGAGAGGNRGLAPTLNFSGLSGLADLFGPSRPDVPEKQRSSRISARAVEDLSQQFFKRKRMIDKFLARSEAFRLYFEQCSNDDREEIYAAMKGPAFDSMLDGMGFRRPLESTMDSETLEERMLLHEKNFEEFVAAKEWQEKQFFGFLGQLSDEQLVALCKREDARNVCVMLRFLKPAQSAAILDHLSSLKRTEVISYTHEVSELPFADLITYEKSLRTAAQRLPFATFGNSKEDPEFWGSVLNESQHQEELFNDIEKTNPGLSPLLKKFKFKLEDAASLPDNLLNKVLGNIDNEELCLALSTCTDDVVEVFLDAVSPARKNMIAKHMETYRDIPKERGVAARSMLTRKFREVLA